MVPFDDVMMTLNFEVDVKPRYKPVIDRNMVKNALQTHARTNGQTADIAVYTAACRSYKNNLVRNNFANNMMINKNTHTSKCASESV